MRWSLTGDGRTRNMCHICNMCNMGHQGQTLAVPPRGTVVCRWGTAFTLWMQWIPGPVGRPPSMMPAMRRQWHRSVSCCRWRWTMQAKARRSCLVKGEFWCEREFWCELGRLPCLPWWISKRCETDAVGLESFWCVKWLIQTGHGVQTG